MRQLVTLANTARVVTVSPMPSIPSPPQPSCAQDYERAEAALRQGLASLDQALVAFSAGVDSTYLLAVAHDVLGPRVQAVTADSPSLARASLREAQAFCAARGMVHRIVATDEFERSAYRANEGMRCYECKAALFRAMHGLVDAVAFDGSLTGGVSLLLGAVVDDFADVRPGLRAAAEAGAQWPLVDAGFTKDMVRQASRRMGLATWDRPAEPCLSSRFPYGETVTVEGLRMIEAAEATLRAAGLRECRVRHHAVGSGRGYLCRIEVPESDLDAVMAQRRQLLPALRAHGYHFISLDLAGLQSGGFNQLLQPSEVHDND